MNEIITNCPLCEKRALHLIGKEDYQMQQCINCGYVTFEKFKLNDKDLSENKSYNESKFYSNDEMNGMIADWAMGNFKLNLQGAEPGTAEYGLSLI